MIDIRRKRETITLASTEIGKHAAVKNTQDFILASSSVALASNGTRTVLLAPDTVTLKVPDTSTEVSSAVNERLCTSRTNRASDDTTTFCTSATPANVSVMLICPGTRGSVVYSSYSSKGRSPRRVCDGQTTRRNNGMSRGNFY